MRDTVRRECWLGRTVLALGLLCLSVAAQAVVEAEKLSSPDLELRYRVLIEEMRCPKCQNQNLADSNAPISVDLRREIRRLLEEGFSDREIVDYMVARYGDFILYRPPVQGNTLALWLAPGLFALIGLLALILIVVRSRSGTGADQGDDSGELSDDERRRLNKLLGHDPGDWTGSGKKSK
ncbi:cytochrome c-type biogenesis protein [Microbulbifer sp. 2205BS26-8]|uniref:cytochrome c-type biogenesis protein n=1 Tax=Microbulbifer sp. 2205BS26-8 TaxID=3064386 RepID=UPI00273E6A0D|nr:cytochrome c-type biogenesis protein [Microbulbifer sp. 2205BS26-8]MDP5210297.1 cytochrome c-type biogenesis protein CcmH [Microbulbifer sp. 2205BS26-8]